MLVPSLSATIHSTRSTASSMPASGKSEIGTAPPDRSSNGRIVGDLARQRARQAFELLCLEVVEVLVPRVVLEVKLARSDTWRRILNVDVEAVCRLEGVARDLSPVLPEHSFAAVVNEQGLGAS